MSWNANLRTALRLLISLALWVTVMGGLSAQTLTLSDCPTEGQPWQGNYQQSYFASDGDRRYLVVSESDQTPAVCANSVQLGKTDAGVVWAGVLSDDSPDDQLSLLVLQGSFGNDSTEVAETFINTALSAIPEPRPLSDFALTTMSATVFGVEGRASRSPGNQVTCAPGDKPAGVFWRSELQLPANLPLLLQVTASGQGAFGVALGDWRRDEQESPLHVGEMLLASDYPQHLQFAVPANSRPWTSFTLLCPEAGGALELGSIQLVATEISTEGSRGAWFWSPDVWQDAPESIWQQQAEQRLSEVYVSVPVGADGTVSAPDELARFIADARTRGLDVWAVLGDPRDVLATSWPALENRLRAFTHYNAQVEPAARLAGVQLDIEPHILPGFALAQNHWRERYLATVHFADTVLGGALPLDLVMPAWWGNHASWGGRLLHDLPTGDVRITVMNYHTDPERLRLSAAPFLAWAENAGSRVTVALESGSLADETQRQYAQSDNEGELWAFNIGQARALVLFSAPQTGLNGRAFSQ